MKHPFTYWRGVRHTGTYREFAELSVIKEDSDRPDAAEMIRRLIAAHKAATRTIRGILPLTEDAPDQVFTDLLVLRLDTHEVTAWLLRGMITGAR